MIVGEPPISENETGGLSIDSIVQSGLEHVSRAGDVVTTRIESFLERLSGSGNASTDKLAENIQESSFGENIGENIESAISATETFLNGKREKIVNEADIFKEIFSNDYNRGTFGRFVLNSSLEANDFLSKMTVFYFSLGPTAKNVLHFASVDRPEYVGSLVLVSFGFLFLAKCYGDYKHNDVSVLGGGGEPEAFAPENPAHLLELIQEFRHKK